MIPSRTYTIAVLAIVSTFILGAAGLLLFGLVAFIAPEQIGDLATAAPTLGTICLALAGAGGLGSGAMGLRDYGSGGLTSSQAASVVAARRE